MSHIYNCLAVRKVCGAGHCFFKNGIVHPDRILEEHDFIYIVEGSWEIYQNNDKYIAKQGDVIILHAGEHHYGLQPCEKNTKTMYFHVYYDKSDRYNVNSKVDNDEFVELDTLIHCPNNTNVVSLFNDIIFTCLSDISYKDARMTALFNLLICELYNNKNKQVIKKIDYSDSIICAIQQNPHKFFTARELSSDLFICERTLMNYFYKKFGKSIYRYQLDFKLETVRKFLVDYPEVKLYEVAANFGFYDEFHLSKLFKKKYGLSPDGYRKSLR